MANEPYYPSREYLNVDMSDIPHPDSSQWTHNHIRYGWNLGQQLWGVDYNGNNEWVGWWFARWAHYRRKYTSAPPPYYTGMLKVYALDPNHYTGSIDGAVRNCIAYTVPMAAFFLKPWPGCRCMVLADRMMIAYSQGEWKAAFRFEKKYNVEVAFFISQPKSKSVIARYKVDQHIRFEPNNLGRCRNWPIRATRLEIRKNGDVVGYAYKSIHASFASASIVVDFEPGDVMEIYAPGKTLDGRNVALSILGTIIT